MNEAEMQMTHSKKKWSRKSLRVRLKHPSGLGASDRNEVRQDRRKIRGKREKLVEWTGGGNVRHSPSIP